MSSLAEVTVTEKHETQEKDLVRYGSVDHLDVRRGSIVAHTLEHYASAHFRKNNTHGRRTLRRTFSGQIHHRQQTRNNLWRFSLDPIQIPLLKKTCELSQELQQKACHCFRYIMKYMGDYPTRKSTIKTALTDSIFQPPLSHEELRDEIYCQIVKQVTQNRKRSSEERGWELLWFISGLFSPSDPDLLNELELFAQSYRELWPVALDIQERLSTVSKVPFCRIYPPHITEVNAIQNKSQNLYQKILIPDESSQAVQIHSLVKCQDICSQLVELLGLQSVEGFGLVLTTENDVFGSNSDDYFMDFLHESTKHVYSTGSDNDDLYQIVFVKIHHVNTDVGCDYTADIVFHFPQELSKYLHGCYKVGADEATQIGSYIYRSKFGSQPFHLDSFNTLIPDLVPVQSYMEHSLVDWEDQILSKYRQHSILSSEEAKISFLKCLSRWPVFASHFFEVTQYLGLGLKRDRILAINQNYILLLNASNDVVESHSLSSVISWSYSVKAYQLKLSLKTGVVLSLVTTLYYEISQLLTYYSNYASTNKDTIYTKHRISILCDSIA